MKFLGRAFTPQFSPLRKNRQVARTVTSRRQPSFFSRGVKIVVSPKPFEAQVSIDKLLGPKQGLREVQKGQGTPTQTQDQPQCATTPLMSFFFCTATGCEGWKFDGSTRLQQPDASSQQSVMEHNSACRAQALAISLRHRMATAPKKDMEMGRPLDMLCASPTQKPAASQASIPA